MFGHRMRRFATIVMMAVASFSIDETIAADWEQLRGERLQILFDNKTHKGDGFSIFYDGYGNRILNMKGRNYPADYYVRDDGYIYSSQGSYKSAEIWQDAGDEYQYRICQKGMCWEMQVFEGNVDDLR